MHTPITPAIALAGLAVLCLVLWILDAVVARVLGPTSRARGGIVVVFLASIAGGVAWLALTVDPSETEVLHVYELSGGRVAMLVARHELTGPIGDGVETKQRGSRTKWRVVVFDGATGARIGEAPLVGEDDTMGASAWIARSGDRAWVGTAAGLLLVDLTEPRVLFRGDELASAHDVFAPPWELHARTWDRATGELLVRDRVSRWWRVAGDLTVKPSTEAEGEVAWLAHADASALGCTSQDRFDVRHVDGRGRLSLFGVGDAHHGREAEPEPNMLNERLVTDLVRGCATQSREGAYFVHASSLAQDAPLLLSLARFADGELAWTTPLVELCEATGTPRGGLMTQEGVALLWDDGRVCAVRAADGTRAWLAPPPPATETPLRIVEVAAAGAEATLWLASSPHDVRRQRVDLAAGTVRADGTFGSVSAEAAAPR